jgi:phosphate transport system substrate-binding protein
VDFTFSRLVNADLSQQDLSAAYFDDANMAGAIMNRIQLAGGLLDRVNLSGADLRYADLSGSWINLSTLVSANLERANLSGASLIGADMTGANLIGASLVGANLVGTQLRGADLRGADLSDAQLVATPELLDKNKQSDISLQKMSDTQWEKLNLSDTDLDGIKYDDQTLWPKDFEIPKSAIYQPGIYSDPVKNQPSADFILIKVSGSTTVIDVARPLAKAYMFEHPNVFFEFVQSDSAAGIADVAAGVAHVAMISRDMTINEKSRYKFINELQIASDSIIVVTNLDNPLNGLTMDQLKGIFSGAIKNWKQLSGEDIPVEIVVPQTTLLEQYSSAVMNGVQIPQGITRQVLSNPAVRTVVATQKGAIGILPSRSEDNSVKTMMLDGCLPTLETVQSGKYPIARPFYLAYHFESYNRIKPWLDFIASSTGRKIILQEGFDPAAK